VWDVRYVMDILDFKTSINHNVAMDDARAIRHDRVVICNTDAAWRMRGKLVQKLQMSCEVKCAPGVQDGCQKRILWQRREGCRCSWCSLHAIGDLEAVITLVAIGGPLCIGRSSRVRCNIEKMWSSPCVQSQKEEG